MKRYIFIAVAIAALLFMTAGSLSAFDFSIYTADKQAEKQEKKEPRQEAKKATYHTGAMEMECLSILNEIAEEKAAGRQLWIIDRTVCSCMEYCEDSDLDSETCNNWEKNCAEQPKGPIKKAAEHKTAIFYLQEIVKPNLPDNTKEIMCTYLFNSALEKDMSFTGNVPCDCSSYCNSSSIGEKVMCKNFDINCAFSTFYNDEDDEIKGSGGKDVITDGEDTDLFLAIKSEEDEIATSQDLIEDMLSDEKREDKRPDDTPLAYDASLCSILFGKYLNGKINVEDVPCVCADQCSARGKACFLLKLSCVQSEEEETKNLRDLFNDKDYKYGEPAYD